MIRAGQLRILTIHCIAWASFILYEVTVAVVMGSKAPFLDFTAFYFLDICLFYFNSDVVFRFSQTPKKVVLIVVPLVIMELAVYAVLSLVIGLFIYKSQTGWSYRKIVNDDIVRATWRGIYITGLSTGYWFFKRTVAVTKESNQFKILQLEAEKSKAETEKNLAVTQVAYLKSQISPHFLFNTLNYIYNSVEKVSPDTSKGILLLSDIMRYSLGEIEDDGKVPLNDEIAHIERYVELTQLRFSNELFISFNDINMEECRSYRVPQLILLTFVENVFKHGDLTKRDNPAIININCSEGMLHLYTSNRKRNGLIESGTRIGIENARTRLNLYYPSAFNLSLNNTSTHFNVDLRIRL
jgi:two-component system LytT family sensor kinase